MEMGQYPKRVTYPCELFDTESENDLAQGQQMPGAFKPPAPQAPVRYTCVQDLSEASLGSLLLCVAPQLWLAASSSRYKTSCPGRRQLADLLNNLHCFCRN